MSSAPEPKHQKVGWLELFYDLIFVVVIEKLTHLLHDNPSGGRIWLTLGLTFAVWVAWFNVSALTNISGEVGPRGRPFVFISMAGMGVLALGVEGVPHEHFWLFVIGYTIARSATWPLWMRGRERARWSLVRALVYGPGLSALWLLTPLLPSHKAIGFAILFLCILESSLSFYHEDGTHTQKLHGPHMVERIGLLLMIVLGESVAQVVTALDEKRTAGMWVTAACAMALICSLWWLIYEASMAKLEEVMDHDDSHIADFIGGSQLAIISGLIMIAAGLADAIHSAGEEATHLHHGPLTCLCLGLLFVSLGVTSLARRAFTTALGVERFDRHAQSKELRAQMKGKTRAERDVLREQIRQERRKERENLHAQVGEQSGNEHHTGMAWLQQLTQLALFFGVPILVWHFGSHAAPWVVILVLLAYVIAQIFIQAIGERRITAYLVASNPHRDAVENAS